MNDYYARPLSASESLADLPVTTWCWADHDGWHQGSGAPLHTVPTGHAWGWGESTWVHVRFDSHAPRAGLVLSTVSDEGMTPAIVVEEFSEKLPSTVDQVRFLLTAPGVDESSLRGRRMRGLTVLSPTQAFLLGAP